MWWGPTSMTKNHDGKWAFSHGWPETQLHDILRAVHDGKPRGRSKGEKNIREFPVMVGGRCRAMRVSLVHVRAWVRGVGL